MIYNDLKFKISSGLKNIIGSELITDDFSAVFELIKNAFDAHATEVEIIFKNLETNDAKIIISDNGKGMDYQDLINKWLFVAYSAKNDGTEDEDYRDKIKVKRYYAGAKGIGRFSCDKLGTQLRLYTTKMSDNLTTEEILVDWLKFEQHPKDEFIDISVKHQTLQHNPSKYTTGTTLEISNLRNDSVWGRAKILKLKSSLAKLINPFDDTSKRKFEIRVIAEEFSREENSYTNSRDRVNGIVENNILEILKLKTIKIASAISSDGKIITTELSNNGEWLYKITEKNVEFNLLRDILVELYFLDPKAKNNFTRLMGLRSAEYGSVFLYKNGIRFYPFGEPDDDSFALDSRRAKRLGDYVGTNDLIGRIEIYGENGEFKETTSRGDGLIKNMSYEQLRLYFIDKVVIKLESFRRNIVRYGIDLDEFENNQHSKEQIVKLIADVSSNDNLISIDFNPNLIAIIDETQEKNNSTKSLIKNIEKIARESNNSVLLNQVHKIKGRLEEALTIAEIAEKEISFKDKVIKEKETQNLFLKSLKNQDFQDLVSLMHHIGISSGIISTTSKILTYKADRNIPIENQDLKNKLALINLENQKILSISRFATKANFRMNAENQNLNLVEFIVEYIQNIASIYNENINILIEYVENLKFRTTFRPIEMTILIDNLISNSKKANAKNIRINIYTDELGRLIITFKDDGIGIPLSIEDRIFDYGFTTTGGSGLGLMHVKEILDKVNGKITLNKNNGIGTEFIISFKK